MASTIDKNPKKCSAVSTMERAMPDFDYSHLVKELEQLIKADIENTPEKFDPKDIENVKQNRWTVERYLLRTKLDVMAAHKMMKASFEFKNQPMINICEFPVEFYSVGAVFTYEPDRKGNIPVYIRVKVNQKIPIVQEFLKAFLFRIIEKADIEANGKGIIVIFDLQDAGISNVDMDLLFFLISSLVNYFPKGLSYMLVHQLSWILRSVWRIARQWLSDDHKDLIKFSDSQSIYEYIEEKNLPDFMGGSCQRDYRAVPKNSITITQAAKRWNLDEEELLKIRKKYAQFLPNEQAC